MHIDFFQACKNGDCLPLRGLLDAGISINEMDVSKFLVVT
jgi:hypothetical protein